MIENIENHEDGATTLDLYAVPLDVLTLTQKERNALLKYGITNIGDCVDVCRRFGNPDFMITINSDYIQHFAPVMIDVVKPQLIRLGYL